MVRLRFPDDTQIEANFALMEKINEIYLLIKEALENPNEEFYLFQFPPAKKLIDLNKNIHQEKLEPSTLLYVKFPKFDNNFNIDKSYKFIKADFVEKYKCIYK